MVDFSGMLKRSKVLKFALYLLGASLLSGGSVFALIANAPAEMINRDNPATVSGVLYGSVLFGWVCAQANVKEINQVRAYLTGVLVCGTLLSIAFFHMGPSEEVGLSEFGGLLVLFAVSVAVVALKLGVALLYSSGIDRVFGNRTR